VVEVNCGVSDVDGTALDEIVSDVDGTALDEIVSDFVDVANEDGIVVYSDVTDPVLGVEAISVVA
jgi:hypothetical protein